MNRTSTFCAGSRQNKNLVRRGLVRPAQSRLDTRRLKTMRLPEPTGKGDILGSLIADREGR